MSLAIRWVSGATAKRFFKCLRRNHENEPRKIVTDTLRSYGGAQLELIPEAISAWVIFTPYCVALATTATTHANMSAIDNKFSFTDSSL